MFDLKKFQAEHKAWIDYNFPGREPYYHLLGAVEEVGELAHAHLKMKERIRGTEAEHMAAAADAVADAIIFLAGYCSDMGFDLEQILSETWAKVRERDFVKYPETGRP